MKSNTTMRFNKKKTIISALLAASLTAGVCAERVNLHSTFRNEDNMKNIAFVSTVGGATHVNWVLSIGDELVKRNHNVTFMTADDHLKFGRNFPLINTVSVSPVVVKDKKSVIKRRAPSDIVRFWLQAMSIFSQNLEKDYLTTYQSLIDHNIDLVLCDHFADFCMDAANMVGIPYIVTSALDFSAESSAPYVNTDIFSISEPTTEFESFASRFVNKFVRPSQLIYGGWSHFQEIKKRKQAIGITTIDGPPSTKWKHSLQIVNSLFGFTAPRPIGPLAEYIGPIIPPTYDALTPELSEFLNNHERVAYIAFGQHATPSEKDIVKILSGVLESIEQGSLDGFIWATVGAAGLFPDTITTSSNTTYDVQEMYGEGNPHIRLIKWAPQTAILMHPSSRLFVSHGGLGSWYESMYSGTPMIMFPFFGDQLGNAITIEREGLGGVLRDEYNSDQVVGLFKRISADADGSIKKNCQRYQALVQIHSERGVDRGADLVEEVMYTNKNGLLPHREAAFKRMSYAKAHNLDLYAAAGCIAFVALGSVVGIIKLIVGLVSSSGKVHASEKKVKRL